MPETNTPWTAERVREELPDVRVSYNGTESIGCVRGRLNPFATVGTKHPTGANMSAEFSWDSVAWALNHDRILYLD